MNSARLNPWIACQLGAREHYSIPVALRRAGRLRRLITDFWAGHARLLAASARQAGERSHPELPAELVKSFPWPLSLFEARAKLAGLADWDHIIARNNWFQGQALAALRQEEWQPGERPVLFSYSYTALRPFEFAKARGWTAVLGQIDPGPAEERIVAGLHHEPALRGIWKPAPPAYWEAWREECRLADHILVNSEWSRHALIEEGVPGGKIGIVPLAYDPPREALAFKRTFPGAFTRSRPLRALFLGQVNLRKGAHLILEALPALEPAPVEFHFVGPVQIEIPERLRRHPQVVWHGAVARGETARHYRAADVFLFPTLSDGFGLTQLEARAWSLPVIASRRCGEVVQDGRDGRVIDPPGAEQLAGVLRELTGDPRKLAALATPWDGGGRFSLEALASALLSADAAARVNHRV